MTSVCNMSNNLPKPHDKRHQTEKKRLRDLAGPRQYIRNRASKLRKRKQETTEQK